MSKIKIDTDVHAGETFKNEIEAKISAFKTLLNNLEQFVDTIDLKALYNNPEAYCKEAIIKEYAGSYKGIKHSKLFDLIGFDLRELEIETNKFKSVGHHFDPKTLEYTTPDFNIYAITEDQIARYHAVNNAVKALLELSKHRAIHPGQLIQATNRALKPDYENSFVKGETTFVLTGGFPRGM
mgnify:CR=1 FL=1